MSVRSNRLMVLFKFYLAYQFILREECWKPAASTTDSSPPHFNLLRVFLHVFGSSVVRSIHIWNCYVFLMKRTCTICTCLSLIFGNVPFLEASFSGINIAPPAFWVLVFYCNTFSSPGLSPVRFFTFKVASCCST